METIFQVHGAPTDVQVGEVVHKRRHRRILVVISVKPVWDPDR